MDIIDKINNLNEASAAQAAERFHKLKDLLNTTDLDSLEAAGMKTQKEAAKLFQQLIKLIQGL